MARSKASIQQIIYYPLFLLVAFALSPHGLAQDAYEKILYGQRRPTIKDIANIQIPDEPGIPIGPSGQLNYSLWLGVLTNHAPQLIAQLEKAVPGATWAFLGRDTAALADAVEAFYESIGQTGRVVRIGMSKTTFWANGNGNQIATDSQIVESLETYGFDLANFKTSHPFILIDTLSKGGGRQGRLIIDAVYSTYASQGGDPADLVRRFNMIGLATSTYKAAIVSIDDSEAILNDNEYTYRALHELQHARNTRFFDIHQILMIPHAPKKAHESGYEHHVGAWHGRFGPYAYDSDGKLRATIDNAHDVDIRKSILWLMREIVKKVQTPDFLAQVEQAAHDLGYTFSKTRPGQLTPKSGSAGELAERMAEVDQKIASADFIDTSVVWKTLLEMGPQVNSPRLSPAGEVLLKWFMEAKGDYEPNNLGYELLVLLRDAKEKNLITTRDLSILAKEVFAVSETSNRLVHLIAKFKEENSKFYDLLESDTWMKSEEGWQTLSEVKQVLSERKSCPGGFL